MDASGPIAAKLAAGLAVAVVLQLILPRTQNPFVLPGILLLAILTMHLALPLTGSSLVEARAGGWTFQPQPAASLSVPWQPAAFHDFP
ncbi:MAG: hypothetical protein EXQ83_16870 [Xanthobacteraceae bacterium]|nr:hypothetical protein [Xanthobacteraceae bacterium]